MIPLDSYTVIVIVLLVFLGLTGIVRPRWFITLSRFPFIARNYPPITENQQRLARRWGALSLVGAVILIVLAGL